MFGFQPIKSSGFSSLLFKQRALVGTVIGDDSLLLLFWKQKCGQEFIYYYEDKIHVQRLKDPILSLYIYIYINTIRTVFDMQRQNKMVCYVLTCGKLLMNRTNF